MMKMKEYDQLQEGFLKIKYVNFFLLIITMVVTIAFFLIPFCSYEYYEEFSANDFESPEEFQEYTEGLTMEEILLGKVKRVKQISIVAELEYACDELSFGWSYYAILICLVLLCCEGLYVVIKLGLTISAKYVGNSDPNKYMRLKYNELLEKAKTRGRITKKEFLDSTGIGSFYGLLSSFGIYAVLMVVNAMLHGPDGELIFENTAISNAEAISPFCIFLVLMLGAVVVLDAYTRKLNAKMMPEVLAHHNEQKSQQKAKKENDQIRQEIPQKEDQHGKNVPHEKAVMASQNITATAIAEELEVFQDMLKKGLITQEEFETKKKQLLGF